MFKSLLKFSHITDVTKYDPVTPVKREFSYKVKHALIIGLLILFFGIYPSLEVYVHSKPEYKYL